MAPNSDQRAGGRWVRDAWTDGREAVIHWWDWTVRRRYERTLCAWFGHRRAAYFESPARTSTAASSLVIERCRRCGVQEVLL